MALPEFVLSEVTRFGASLEGAWQAERNTTQYKQREWRGVLRSDQSFVAVAMMSDGKTLGWCRTRFAASQRQDVRFTFSRFGAGFEQFTGQFSVADATVQAGGTIGNDDAALPLIGGVRGGEIQALIHVGRNARASFGAWLISAADARSARNHTWHLRTDLPADADPLASRILGGPRNGWIGLG
jgi:hypothetical protein